MGIYYNSVIPLARCPLFLHLRLRPSSRRFSRRPIPPRLSGTRFYGERIIALDTFSEPICIRSSVIAVLKVNDDTACYYIPFQ